MKMTPLFLYIQDENLFCQNQNQYSERKERGAEFHSEPSDAKFKYT